MTEAKAKTPAAPTAPSWAPDMWDYVVVGAGAALAALIIWYWWRNRDQHTNDDEDLVVGEERDPSSAPGEGPLAA